MLPLTVPVSFPLRELEKDPWEIVCNLASLDEETCHVGPPICLSVHQLQGRMMKNGKTLAKYFVSNTVVDEAQTDK